MIHKTRQFSVFFLLLIVPATVTYGKDPNKAAGDVERLQGTWLADLEPGLQARLELKGSDLLYVHVRDKRETVIWDGNFAVNEKARPKQMDWTPLRRGNRDIPSSLAIYQLQGDLLLIVGNTEGPRPTAFYCGGGPQRPKTVIFHRVQTDKKRRNTRQTGNVR
jgi:uncharacterized protein (TIGR03067 family)